MALPADGAATLSAALVKVAAELASVPNLEDVAPTLSRLLSADLDIAPRTLLYLQAACACTVGLLVVVAACGFRRLLQDPVEAKYGKVRKSAARGGGMSRRGKGGGAREDSPDVSDASTDAAVKQQGQQQQQQQGAAAAAAPPRLLPKPRVRSRATHVVPPNSTIKGFVRVSVLMTSPCGEHFLVACRKNLRARRYPQSRKQEFMERGRDLADKAFTSLGPYLGDEKPDVGNAAFSSDGRHLVLGDCRRDQLVVLACPPPGPHGKMAELVPLWSYRLPNHQVVATLFTYVPLRAGEVIGFCDAKECGMSLVRRGNSGKGEPVGSEQKVKIGHPTAYAVSENYCAVGGSMMKECRITSFDFRHDLVSFTLAKCFNSLDFKGVRVSRLALTHPGSPECSTAEWLVVFLENGKGFIYDVPYSDRHSDTPAALIGSFSDPDFANGAIDGMAVTVRGHQYHERLVVALWHRSDISVFSQNRDLACQTHGTRGTPTPLEHLVDYHDALDGEPIGKLCFLQHGLGLAAAGEEGSTKGIRMWSLPLAS